MKEQNRNQIFVYCLISVILKFKIKPGNGHDLQLIILNKYFSKIILSESRRESVKEGVKDTIFELDLIAVRMKL